METRSLPVASLRESPLNRRSVWGNVDELAESIKKLGILQPITVRPLTGDADDRPGPETFEIVLGHRRVRGAKLAGRTEVEALVVYMTDGEALEAMAVENGNRTDVHPLDEAELFDALLKMQRSDGSRYTVEDIASKTGRSREHVYKRLKLLALCPAARRAFLAGAIDVGLAVALARLPSRKMQEEALPVVAANEARGPLPSRQAIEYITGRFMLRIDSASAPFDPTDAELVAGVPPCPACPKRTGNQPALFADMGTDLCVEAECYRTKADAAWRRRVAAAHGAGQTVLSEEACAELFRYGAELDKDSPYVDLAALCPDDPRRRTWRELMGESSPPVSLARDQAGRVRELVHRRTARRLANATLEALEEPSGPTVKRHRTGGEESTEIVEDAEAARQKVRERAYPVILARIVARVEAKGELPPALLRVVAKVLAVRASRTLERRGVESLDEALEKMKGAELAALVVEMACEAGAAQAYRRGEGGPLLEVLAALRLDLAKLEAEANEANAAAPSK